CARGAGRARAAEEGQGGGARRAGRARRGHVRGVTRAGHVLVLTLLASLAAGSPVQAAGAQRFVPAMNAICREESARAQASFDKLPRSSQVDLDLSHSRMTPV